MSIELGKYGIRCNAIAPGYVDSEYNEQADKDWADDHKKWLKEQIED